MNSTVIQERATKILKYYNLETIYISSLQAVLRFQNVQYSWLESLVVQLVFTLPKANMLTSDSPIPTDKIQFNENVFGVKVTSLGHVSSLEEWNVAGER